VAMARTLENAPGKDWAGLVLAGGASTRMGTDKALLTLEGHTLLDRAVGILRRFGADPVLVSGNRPGYDCVPDSRPGLGPLGGLESILAARGELAGRWMMVIPVDMPYLDTETLGHLAGAAQAHGGGAACTQYPLPLAIRVTDGLADAVDRALAGTGSIRDLVGDLGLARVEREEGRPFENFNTPQAWLKENNA